MYFTKANASPCIACKRCSRVFSSRCFSTTVFDNFRSLVGSDYGFRRIKKGKMVINSDDHELRYVKGKSIWCVSIHFETQTSLKMKVVRASSNPLSVLGGIQLSGLPGPPAEIIAPCLALVRTWQPFHSAPGTSAFLPPRMIWIGYRFCSGANHL